MFVVLTTVPNNAEGEELAEKIVEARLAACVQILPQMMSIYLWDGKLQRTSEHLLLIKTLPEKFDQLSAFIITNHSYEIPEIVAIDAARVSAPYRDWILKMTGDGDK